MDNPVFVVDEQYEKSITEPTKTPRDVIPSTRETNNGENLVTTRFSVCNRQQISQGSQVRDSPMSECGPPDGGPHSDISESEGSLSSPISECVPPDGGWGWSIAAGSLLCHILLEGFSRSLGILFKTTLRVFGGTNAQTAVHQSLFNTLRMVLGKYITVMLKMTYKAHYITSAAC